jgi:tRNA (guanine37-N1)-methyltransferase
VQISILTLFPEMFQGVLQEGILSRALAQNLLKVNLVQIRDFTTDKHRTVDDQPYGGGAGMVMKPEPLYAAWESIQRSSTLPLHTIYLSPQGRPLQQCVLHSWAKEDLHLVLVCGRYEGVDERFIELCVDEEISLGDFVLSGGEIGAMAILDGVMRLLPGALGNAQSLDRESFAKGNGGLLEAPQYTRPPEFKGLTVPEVLLSGNHSLIAKWREEQALARTQEKRPDLLKKRD